MMLSRLRLFLFFLIFCNVLSAQIDSGDRLRDTIFYRSSFLNRTYLLDGKPLSLPVMAFFMKEYPTANNEIGMAQLSDQLCIAGYSIGSLFAIGGLLISRQDRDLGGDLLRLGGIGIGSGLIFQLVSGRFKFQAVKQYNRAVRKERYREEKTSRLQFRIGAHGLGVVVGIR